MTYFQKLQKYFSKTEKSCVLPMNTFLSGTNHETIILQIDNNSFNSNLFDGM